jgi:hypothetical protein
MNIKENQRRVKASSHVRHGLNNRNTGRSFRNKSTANVQRYWKPADLHRKVTLGAGNLVTTPQKANNA